MWKGIAIAGIWIASAASIIMGGHASIFVGATIATLAVASA